MGRRGDGATIRKPGYLAPGCLSHRRAITPERSPVHRPFVRILVLATSLLLASTANTLAGPITGRVVDPDGRAVPAATVLLIRGTMVIGTAVTDAAGAFATQAPDQGSFELRVVADGFRAQPTTVGAKAEAQDVGTIALTVSAVSESVVVSAAQVEVPLSTTSSSVSVITGEELKARQVESVADALRLVPGLTVAASGGRGAITSVFPRGGESDYSLVLVDGVEANAFGGGFDFAHLPIVNIDRIEIVRGPQSALFGSNAIGSVIRVITKHGGPPTADASFEGGGFGTTRATAATSGGIGPWRWGGSAERLASDGMNGDTTAAGERIHNDDYERHSVAGGLGWTRANGTSVRGDVNYLKDERGFPGPFGSNPVGNFSGISDSRGTDERWLLSVSGVTPVNRRVRAQAQATHARIDGLFTDSASLSRRTTARFQADVTVTRDLDASAGAEFERERAGSTYITAEESREVPVERGLIGGFAEARWNHSARLFVTTGLRVERITRDALPGDPDGFASRPDFPDDTVVSVNPKVAAAWYLPSRGGTFTKVRASAGTGIRPPDGFEIAFTDNPSLKPERSRSFDAGIDQAFLRGHALVEATAFFNWYDDLIVAVGSFRESSRFRTDNISNARSRGAEITGTFRARAKAGVPLDLQLRVAYTLLDTEILAADRASSAPSPFMPGQELLRRPKHQYSADVLITSGRFTGYVQGGGRSGVLDVEPSFGAFGGLFDAPGYTVWNAGASWKLVPHVELFGRVNNVFDRRYEEVLGYPALGRTGLAGFRIVTSR
jgi:outer membrane cobalamin receptor